MPRPTSILASSILVAGGLAIGACGGSADPTATERLWVSGVPTSPKAPITAFLATRASDGKYIGAFFKGSLFRGGHDVFEWRENGRNGATLKFLQDGNTRDLKFETCKPSRGFDYCLIVHGDPTGTGRYQSRKRWAVRRGKKKKQAEFAPVAIPDAIAQLAEDDEDLRAALGED